MSDNNSSNNDEFLNSGKGGKKPGKKPTGTKGSFKRPKKLKAHETDRLGSNPFMKKYKIPVTPSFDRYISLNDPKRFVRTVYAANKEDINAIENDQFMPFLLESKFLRVYLEHNQGLRQKLFSLKPTAHSLFLWILFHLEYGKDYILLNRQDLTNKLHLKSKDTFYNARNELIENGIIQKTKVNDYYWINAQMFFVGNRPSYYPEQTFSKEMDLHDMKRKFKEDNNKTIERRKEIREQASLNPLVGFTKPDPGDTDEE